MSNGDTNKTKSSNIIEEIIPGKNNDYNGKSINQNDSENQQPLIENYNEQESAQAVVEVKEEIEKIMSNTD
jgi:hypothetical protein